MGPRGDVIVEADWCIGELLKTLEQEGILENTLIVYSSDQGFYLPLRKAIHFLRSERKNQTT